MKSYQKILIGVIIGLISFPTIGLGSSVIISLIQGKTPAEAIHILAEQIDSLVSRVETVETNQEDIIDEQQDLVEALQLLQQSSQVQISKNEACGRKREFLNQATEILTCNSSSQWWGGNQTEGTIDAIVVCLQNQISEEPWIEKSGTKASGTITAFNEYGSESQLLIASTRFLSSNGKIFRTTKDIYIPGANIIDDEIIPSSIDVEVMADYWGSEYNIGPSDFTIPGFKGTVKYVSLYGKSDTAMSGGSNEITEDIDLKTEYQDNLDQLIILNSKFKVVKAICEE